jgi:hypothetical protein
MTNPAPSVRTQAHRRPALLAVEAAAVNHYGARAQDHWRTHLAGPLARIPDQEAFFARLGETAAAEIEAKAEALAQMTPPAEGYLEEVARLETARKVAEMEVLREIILVDPDDQEKVAQLMG